MHLIGRQLARHLDSSTRAKNRASPRKLAYLKSDAAAWSIRQLRIEPLETRCLLSAGGTARTFIWNIDDLTAVRQLYQQNDPATVAYVHQVFSQSNTYATQGPWSVLDDGLIPPSGDPHDYLSYGSYWWPNPNTPDGLPWIARDGYVNPASAGDITSLSQLSQASEALSIAYFMTGYENFAIALANNLRTWFLNPATKMNASQMYALIVPGVEPTAYDSSGFRNNMRTIFDAAGILEQSPNWTLQDQTALQQWATDFVNFVDTTEVGQAQFDNPANHGTCFDVNKTLLALYAGDTQKARDAIEAYMLYRMPGQFNEDGSFVYEMQRADNLLYTRYHLSVIADLALMAKNYFPDLDLWNYTTPQGTNLRQAFDFAIPYFEDPASWPYNAPGNAFPPDDQLYYWRLLREAAVGFDDPALLAIANANIPTNFPLDMYNLEFPAISVGAGMPTPGRATQLVVTVEPPANLAPNAPFQLIVLAQDANGNVDPAYTSNVSLSFANNPSGATLAGTKTVRAVGGVITFNDLSIDQLGAGFTLQATGSGLTTGVSTPVNVLAATATTLSISSQASTAALNSPIRLVVSAVDAQGNLDPTFNGDISVQLVNNPGAATLTGNLTVQAVDGLATFAGLALSNLGNGYTIRASSTGLTSVVSAPISIVPATPVKLILQGVEGLVDAGEPFEVGVIAVNQFAAAISTYAQNATISLTSGPAGGVLSGTLTRTAANGSVNFAGLTLNKAGTYTFQITSGNLTPAHGIIHVKAAAATHLAIVHEPPIVGLLDPFAVTIAPLDQFGNIDAKYLGSLAIALANNPGGATLDGILSVPFVAGLATFSSLTLSQLGTGYTLQATTAGLPAISTGPIAVVPAAAPVASIAGSATALRGQSQSFTLLATATSAADQDAGFTFVVDWGDGTAIETFTGLSGLQVAHSFSSIGQRIVSITATNQHGVTSNATLRAVVVSAVQLVDNTGAFDLVWTGTAGDDRVRFEQLSATTIRVTTTRDNGVAINFVETITGVTGIVNASGLAGNDTLDAAMLSTTSATLDGGTGNNTLYGGGANDVLIGGANFGPQVNGPEGQQGNNIIVGGAGDDTIYGNAVNGAEGKGGNNILLGGAGNDTIYGNWTDGGEGGGRNIIVGGADADTLYDYKLADGAEGKGSILVAGGTSLGIPQLTQIMAEWASTHTYNDRVANLLGSGSLYSLNGNTYLQPGSTVTSDAAVDQLWGTTTGTAFNWFLYTLAVDLINRDKIGETKTTL